jgi:hypothetical protein
MEKKREKEERQGRETEGAGEREGEGEGVQIRDAESSAEASAEPTPTRGRPVRSLITVRREKINKRKARKPRTETTWTIHHYNIMVMETQWTNPQGVTLLNRN